jgi:hypothetical protein
VVRAALQRQAGGRFVGFDHVEAVLALGREAATATSRAKQVIDLPGQRVQRIRGQLVFAPAAPDPARAGRRRGRPRTDLAKKN